MVGRWDSGQAETAYATESLKNDGASLSFYHAEQVPPGCFLFIYLFYMFITICCPPARSFVRL
jgi:hypothetical protein